ncbi:MAG: hypothetical protein JJV94_08465 [Sulfurospirillum sp.]|nr:hypothetical protein [Sulfurospirillum sp.]
MKRVIILCIFICLSAVGDVLDIRVVKTINLKNANGEILGQPLLKDKEAQKKITLIGSYQITQDNIMTIVFDEIKKDGGYYALEKLFLKESKIKSRSLSLNKNTEFKVSGGNKQEILNILNNNRKPNRREKTNYIPNYDSGTNSKEYSSSNYDSGTNSKEYSYTPNYDSSTNDSDNSSDNTNSDDSTNDSDNSSDNTNSDDTAIDDGQCPQSVYDDSLGIAIFYVEQYGQCNKKITRNVYPLYDTITCRNKTNYTDNTISLGKEIYTQLDGLEYKIEDCKYVDPIALQKKIGTCKAIPDFEKNIAKLQKQYFYVLQNEKYNVGECTPTDDTVPLQKEIGKCKAIPDFEKNIAKLQKQYFYVLQNEKHNVGICTTTDDTVPLENDMNVCESDRHDFTIKKSFPQTQFFYRVENTRNDVGECVDKEGIEYLHYNDDTTCEWKEIDNRVFYKQRVAYNDLVGAKLFATDCQTISSGGFQAYEEFAGYIYNDGAKQAQRKINTYFYVPNTTTKIYIDKNILTNKIYAYKKISCGHKNNDTTLITTFSSREYFNDTDENVEVELQKCKATDFVSYQKLNLTETVEKTLTNQILQPTSNKYKIYGTSIYINNYPNFGRNLTHITGNSSGTFQGATYYWRPRTYPRYTISNKPLWMNHKTDYYSEITGCANSGDCTYRYNDKIHLFPYPNWAHNQIIDKIKYMQEWVRGDGTRYINSTSIKYKYMAR